MNIKTCRYVEASEIFKDCPLAWELFTDSDPDCTWGSNNRTMVTSDVIFGVFDDIIEDVPEDAVTLFAPPTKNQNDQMRLVNSRLDSLEPDVFVDLEN